MIKYRGSHPPPKYIHGQALKGGVVVRRSLEYKQWIYTVLHNNGGITYEHE